MSTSTSSAAIPARGDLLLAAALVATLFAADLTLRAVDDRLSGNIVHVARIPAIAEQIATTGDSRSTLVLGNSLANNGVDGDMLAAALNPGQVAKITPDGTSFWDWQCILNGQLLGPENRHVGTLVMPTAWHLLSDATRADPSRLGALFCQFRDLRAPADLGLSGPADIGEFAAARVSRLYALRDTVRNDLLVHVVPHYERFANEINAKQGRADKGAAAATPDYSHFSALAAAIEAQGTRLVVVAMPVREPYEIDAPLIELAAAGTIRLLDYRHLPGIDHSSFLDRMHLGEQGRAILTAQLARDLTTDETAPR